MKRILLLVGLALFVIAGCGGGGDDDDHRAISPTLSEIVIEPSALSLPPQAEHHLSATAILSDGTRTDVTREAVWESSSPAAATVGNDDACGIVRAIQDGGETVITATVGGVQGRIQVTVTSAGPITDPQDPADPGDPQNPGDPQDPVDPDTPKLSILPQQLTMRPGTTLQLEAFITYPDGTEVEVTNEPGMLWTSSDPDVAGFDFATKKEKGLLLAGEEGTAEITAEVDDMTAKLTVTVSPPDPPEPPVPPL